jgi:hypothetical protein
MILPENGDQEDLIKNEKEDRSARILRILDKLKYS